MIGYHAVSVIADAMAKGIKGFDYEKAFEAAKHSAELNHFGLEAYKKRGYISIGRRQRIGFQNARICLQRFLHRADGEDFVIR